jgi:hypothetical protein
MVKVRKSEYWVLIRKGVEPFEEFDRRKIGMALIRSGLRGPDVERIAAMVEPREGLTTKEIDSLVVSEIEKCDPVVAKRWKTLRDWRRSRFKK